MVATIVRATQRGYLGQVIEEDQIFELPEGLKVSSRWMEVMPKGTKPTLILEQYRPAAKAPHPKYNKRPEGARPFGKDEAEWELERKLESAEKLAEAERKLKAAKSNSAVRKNKAKPKTPETLKELGEQTPADDWAE